MSPDPAMNLHDDLMRRAAAPLLTEQFGLRDAGARLVVVKLTEPDGTVRELTGMSVGALRVSDEIDDEHGTHLRDQIEDVVELTIPRAQAWGAYTAKIGSRLALDDGERFTLLEVLSESPNWSSVRTSRKHLGVIRRGRSERT